MMIATDTEPIKNLIPSLARRHSSQEYTVHSSQSVVHQVQISNFSLKNLPANDRTDPLKPGIRHNNMYNIRRFIRCFNMRYDLFYIRTFDSQSVSTSTATSSTRLLPLVSNRQLLTQSV